MKLKSFNPETIPQNSRQGIAKVNLNSKSGTITFNKTAVEKLQFSGGVKVEFFQDEEEDGDWYFTQTKTGFNVRMKTDNSMIFNSTFLIKKIFDSMAYEKHTGTCMIGAEPVKHDKVSYWPLITSTLKNTD